MSTLDDVVDRLDRIIELLGNRTGRTASASSGEKGDCTCQCGCGGWTKQRDDGDFFAKCYRCSQKPGPDCAGAYANTRGSAVRNEPDTETEPF